MKKKLTIWNWGFLKQEDVPYSFESVHELSPEEIIDLTEKFDIMITKDILFLDKKGKQFRAR